MTNNYGAVFLTLSSVEYEYTRGSQTIDELRSRRAFVRALVDNVYPVGKIFESDKHDVFSAVMSVTVGRKDSDYTDYLLAVALHKFYNNIDKQFVLSADARAFPLSIFDIDGTVTISRPRNEIAYLSLISLNQSRYASVLQKLESKTS